jgi:hypothetical protein
MLAEGRGGVRRQGAWSRAQLGLIAELSRLEEAGRSFVARSTGRRERPAPRCR